MTIGEKIKARRKELKMTTEELGRLIDRDRVLFFLRRFHKGDRNDPLLRRHIIDTFINSVYVYDDHLKIIVNNLEGNQRLPLPDLPPCSDNIMIGVPIVTHPNTRVTVYRIAV